MVKDRLLVFHIFRFAIKFANSSFSFASCEWTRETGMINMVSSTTMIFTPF